MFFVYSPIIRNSLFLFLFSLFSNNLFTASKPSKPTQEVNSELKTCLREKRECIDLKNRTLDLNKSCNESKNNCENEKDTIDVSKKQCENQLLKCTNEETSYLSEKNN
ncbi:MAG: hypothetical protein VYD54_08470, partial [Bdellovibrionota bacterium]|nr:hypothetical protein [Bdellovibrionota bacterium]